VQGAGLVIESPCQQARAFFIDFAYMLPEKHGRPDLKRFNYGAEKSAELPSLRILFPSEMHNELKLSTANHCMVRGLALRSRHVTVMPFGCLTANWCILAAKPRV
jgi:hypothetical protein